MVLMNHGVFSFGDTARESYERMIELVSDAEEYLAQHGAALRATPPSAPPALRRERIAELRREVSVAAGTPMCLVRTESPRVSAFVSDPGFAEDAHAGR